MEAFGSATSRFGDVMPSIAAEHSMHFVKSTKNSNRTTRTYPDRTVTRRIDLNLIPYYM